MNAITKTVRIITAECQDPDLVLKNLLFYCLTCTGTIIVIIFGIRSFFVDDIFLGIIEISFSIMAIVNVTYYKYSNNYKIASRLIQILLAMLLIILTFSEKQSHSGTLLWYYTFPLLVIFLSGKKEGTVWACGLLCISISVMIVKADINSNISYSNLFSFRFVFSYLTCTGLAYVFEFAREESHLKYQKQNIELIRSQEYLKESQQNFQMILSSMRDVIFTIDTSGIIVNYFIPHLKSNLINIPEDYIGNDFRNMLPGHIVIQLEDAIKRIEKGEKACEFEYYTGTAEYKNWFSAKVSKIVNSNNIFKGFLIVARDITKRKEEEEKRIQLERKLVHSEQSAKLGRVAAGMAHEINNPASTVTSDLQILKRMLGKLTISNEQIAMMRLTKRAMSAIFRITNIITALKSSYRKNKWHLTDINNEIDIQLILLQPSIKNRIKVIKNYIPVAQVRAYGNEIGQVILNLLTNAIDSIQGSGQIDIITENKGYFIFISIKDTGVGIANNILPYIFNPFYTTKYNGKGTGLGLSTSLEIIKKHSGRLYVSETAVGKGTTFNFEVLKETIVDEQI